MTSESQDHQYRVLITNQVPREHLAPLDKLAEIIMGPAGALMPREEVLAHAPRLDAIINQAELRVDNELLDAGPGLKIIANVAAGTDNMDLVLMHHRAIVATNTPGVFTESAADHAMALLLAVARRMMPADRYVRGGGWPGDGFRPGMWDGMELDGKTIGILGYGRIGQAVGRRAAAFGMRVIFHNPVESADPAWRTFEDLLDQSDVISIHVPLTHTTHHLIDAAALERMRDGAVLLNLARGKVVVEAALVEALKQGKLAGAGLDVFEFEPQVSPELIAMEQVVMTPHVGGGTIESRKRARTMAAENVARVLRGEPALNPVPRPQRPKR